MMAFVEREIVDIVDDLAFNRSIYVEEADVEKVLEIVQTLDPAGIGARDLQECLLLQLERKTQTPEVRLAYKILYDYYDAFVKKHFQKMMDGLGINRRRTKGGIKRNCALEPKTRKYFAAAVAAAAQNIIPDFFITINEGELEMRLNGRNAPELKISRDYQEMMEHTQSCQRKGHQERTARP